MTFDEMRAMKVKEKPPAASPPTDWASNRVVSMDDFWLLSSGFCPVCENPVEIEPCKLPQYPHVIFYNCIEDPMHSWEKDRNTNRIVRL